MELYLLILAPILISLVTYLLPFRKINYLSIAVQIVTLILAVRNLIVIKTTGMPLEVTIGGDSLMGISLYADSISSVFVVLVTWLFLIFNIFSSTDYIHDKLYMFLFLTLESLIILLFSSRDLFNIFISIEISIIISAMLIMYKRDSRSIYDGLLYLMTNTSGMMFYLLGIAMIYKICGGLDIDYLKNTIRLMDAQTLAIPYALLMVGTGIKCAVIPVFSWLPKAHGTPGAPPIVTAILSGIYIKSSIYLYIRMRDMFYSVINMDDFFIMIGLITSIFGFVFALCQVDLKLILAYHTISQLGLMMIALSINTPVAQAGGMYHIINHALFKSLLALSAGVIIKHYGTRNLYEINGVMRRIPFAGIATLVGILGITGAPFFNGSISKYFIQLGTHGLWVEKFINVINLGTVMSFVKLSNILFDKKKERPRRLREKKTYSLAMMLLSVQCLFLGIFGSRFTNYFFDLDLVVDTKLYAIKTLYWLGFIIVGILVYKFIISRYAFFKKGFAIDLAFNEIVITIVGYFFIILGGLHYLVL